ncbi:MAG: hypothetical protein ACKON9_00245 [Planctomycetaceae bacterium]
MRDWLERFVDDGTIGESQLEEARSMAANLGITPEDALVRLGYIRAEISAVLRLKSSATTTSSLRGGRYRTVSSSW